MQQVLTVALTFFLLYLVFEFVHAMLGAGHYWIAPLLIFLGFAWAWRRDTPEQRAEFVANIKKLVGLK